jgi:citrate lyase subunit beta/citryl-CoA lyase
VLTIATARSFLFAPGNQPDTLRKALASGADAVIADLEDAVVPGRKAAARDVVAGVLGDAPSGPGPLRLVRVNGAGTAWHDDDVALLSSLALDGVVLPKATPDGAAALAAAGLPVVAIAETAEGVRRAFDTAAVPHVAGLMLGAVDLGLDLGLEQRADGLELLHARSTLVLDSAAAGARPPIDRVWTDARDGEGLERDCLLARSLGMRGKACVHPAQIPVVNDAFSPSPAEIEHARGVVAAFDGAAEGGDGVVALEGEMIDLPVVERARQLLRQVDDDQR